MMGSARRTTDDGRKHKYTANLPVLAAIAVVLALPYLSPSAMAQAPGPELFAKEPKTPIELWEAADYLIRTGQAKKAVTYLEKFLKAQPDDATLVALRDRYGSGSFLRLDEDPATRPFLRPLVDSLALAARRYATQPDRIARSIAELTLTPDEQDYAVRRLREAGPYAVPFLVEALRRPGLSDADRGLLVRNMGRLEPSTIPALAAALESSEPAVATAAATAMGSIGDALAVPFLTFWAASPGAKPEVRTAAQAAIARLTGRPFDRQPRSPVRILTDAAWFEHRRRPDFPDELAVVWAWDAAHNTPAPREVTANEARTILGLRFAREALRLDPKDRSAQAAQISLALEKAVEGVKPDEVPAKDPATFSAATAAGPSLLGEVLETAIADGKSDLAAVAVLALAKVTDRASLAAGGRIHPLVRALSAPGRRVQFAAARSLIELAPDRPFPGSSLVAPALARFIMNQPQPRAVVIDGNANRGGRIAGLLMNLGYHHVQERTGSEGFLAAAEAADVELVLVSYDLFYGAWTLVDTLANLQADARTAGIPVFVYGPYDMRIKRPNLERDFPGIRWIVPPPDAASLEKSLKGRPSVLTEADRLGYARDAAALLAKIAADHKSPLGVDLGSVEPALSLALNSPEAARSAAAALSELPDPDAQRSLFDLVLDSSRPPDLRSEAAASLVRSIKRFKPLVTARQEGRIAAAISEEIDAGVRSGMAAILAAMKSAVPSSAVSVRPLSRTRITPAISH
ncbi:MAG: HEAT repeat domain-containing protein [Isosphaeraceae bacterium]